MYNKIIHYGCSFTYGVDSGGDGIDDDKKSYPFYLSEITGIEYINRSNSGSSLSQMSLKVQEDLQNKNNCEGKLAIVNLTSPYRIISSVAPWCKSTHNGIDLYSSNVNSQTYIDDEKRAHLMDVKKLLAFEQDWIWHLNGYNTINSVYYQLMSNGIDVVFVDMLYNIQSLYEYFPLGGKISDVMITGENGSVLSDAKIPNEYKSKSKHLYAKGYEMLARHIYHKMVEKNIL